MLRNRTLRWTVVIWACVLAFGLTFNVQQADALHSTCAEICEAECGTGNCSGWAGSCTCFWVCSNGEEGNSICT